jgi:chaperonin GroEL
MNPMDIRRGMILAVEKVTEHLKQQSIKITTPEELANVATISANNDAALGSLISGIFEKIGTEGTINVQDGKTLEHEVEYVEGLKFDRGYISPYFVTDSKTQKCEFDDAYVLVLDQKLSNFNLLLPLLEQLAKTKKPLLIIAEDVESEPLSTIIINKLRGVLKIAAVKSPGFGDSRKATLSDICVATGSTLISEEVGDNVEEQLKNFGVLGQVKKAIITKDDTILIEGRGEKYYYFNC